MRIPRLELQLQTVPLVVQPGALGLPAWMQPLYLGPESGAMVRVQQMGTFVCYKVVDNALGCLHYQPVVLNAPGGSTVSPFGFGASKTDVGQPLVPALLVHALQCFFGQIEASLGLVKVGQNLVNGVSGSFFHRDVQLIVFDLPGQDGTLCQRQFELPVHQGSRLTLAIVWQVGLTLCLLGFDLEQPLLAAVQELAYVGTAQVSGRPYLCLTGLDVQGEGFAP